MWETIDIVGISHTAGLAVPRIRTTVVLRAKTAHRHRKAPVGWFSVGRHVFLSLIPGACHTGHSWQWYGEDPLHSSKAYQGMGFQLSY